MRNILFFLLVFSFSLISTAQEKPNSVQFFNTIKSHCGKAYQGKIVAGGKEGDGFVGEKLVMHIRSCENNTLKIPFFVGENKSRTWVLNLTEENLVQLKHDHRNPDGTEEEITQYGGISSNTGLNNIQYFPADQHTADLIPTASTNVWWITIDEKYFSYNLRRIGSDRVFSVKFDLTQTITTPAAPWGEKE